MRLAGRNIITKAAGANLAYQFGWKPLVSDLKSLLSTADLIEKRARELKRFYDRGLRYTQDLYSSSDMIMINDWITAQPYIRYKGNITRTTTRKVWGHIRWKPTTLPPRTDAEYRKLAWKAINGFSTSSLPASAWELIPWSWLIDYFSSVGDFLQAHRNTVPAVIDRCVIMEHAKTVTTFDNFSGIHSSFTVEPMNGARVTFETKTRASAMPGISAYLPLLSNRQISILGSLAILYKEKHRL
nr:MAG: hypothetical protein 1 [Leviviridae sp.]